MPDFDLIRPVGRGGFGEVWLAANRTTGHLRAVKIIPLRRASQADPAAREITSLTRLEARLARQHPNLLTIHHVGKTADYLFYVMDPADDAGGGPASDRAGLPARHIAIPASAGPLSPEVCTDYAGQLLAGLASLHAAGMVHRDVKPANCLFVGGQLKLADFGLVTEAHPLVSRVGTQKYMPPDGRMDMRADVYAAGLVIYEIHQRSAGRRLSPPGPASELRAQKTRCWLRCCGWSCTRASVSPSSGRPTRGRCSRSWRCPGQRLAGRPGGVCSRQSGGRRMQRGGVGCMDPRSPARGSM